LVRCDVHHLPFASQSFAFVHCSNVLEHSKSPEEAFSELKRVGRHGFVETPSALFEKIIHHSPRHFWIISWRNRQIVVDSLSGLFDKNIYPLSSVTWWLRKHLPFLWKSIVSVLDVGLNLAYNKYRW